MKVSSAWVKTWLRRTMLSDEEIVAALARAGMEIEHVDLLAEIDKKVVVGLVKEVVQHPAADRLHLVLVTDGTRDFRIVCGAPNVRADLKVALAQIGAVLPNGEKIEKVTLRGEISEGMLCSERELGLGDDHEGILELPDDAVPGTAVQNVYPPDTIIDLKTPANRFDVLSVLGLAREVAAMTNGELIELEEPRSLRAGKGPELEKKTEAGRYMLGHFAVKTGVSTPEDMLSWLQAAGVRAIHPVVDVTNYVMLDIGQPLHAFDAAKVKPPIAVRRAKAGEELTTLDGVERRLTPEDLIITDASGPIALAGVMGGAATEVTTATTEILLEAAVFDAATVRKTAQRHGLRTEASARFERGLPVELPAFAMSRAEQLLTEVAGARLVGVSDALQAKPAAYSITFDRIWLERFVGRDFSSKEIVQCLLRLGIEAIAEGDHILVSKVPWWRPDLRLAEDLAEEVIRVVGYDQVPSTLPAWRPRRVIFDRDRAKRRQLRDVLFAAGLFEVTTYAFISEGQLSAAGLLPQEHLKLKNPLSQEQAYLRSSLWPSHMAVLERNRTYAEAVGFYELSAVFLKQGPGEQPNEPQRLGVTIRRPKGAFAKLKGIVDGLARELNVTLTVESIAEPTGFAAGRTGSVAVGGRRIGELGQVHPQVLQEMKIRDEVAYLELDLAPLLNASRPKQFAGLSKFPAISRDITAELPLTVTWHEVESAVAPQPVTYVDEYQGDQIETGKKALTLRLTVERHDRTPTEAEATEIERAVRLKLTRKLGAIFRAGN